MMVPGLRILFKAWPNPLRPEGAELCTELCAAGPDVDCFALDEPCVACFAKAESDAVWSDVGKPCAI